MILLSIIVTLKVLCYITEYLVILTFRFQLKLLNGFVLRLLLFQCIAASEKSMLHRATFIDWPKKLRGKRGKGLSPPKNKTENGEWKAVTEY